MRTSRIAPLALFTILALGAATVRADIVTSFGGVDGDALANIEARLSLTRYRDRDDIDADFAQRLYDRIDSEVKDALRPFGYYEPMVTTTHRAVGTTWHYDIRIEPGTPVTLSTVNIRITGPGENDPVFDAVRRQTLLKQDAQLYHPAYEGVKGEMVRAAAANGYLGARLLENQMLVDTASHTASIALHLDTGPRYNFGTIDIDQNVIRPELMRRFLRFSESEPYDTNALLRTQFALDDSLYFATVDVEPGDPDPATLTVPVRISASKARKQITIGGGYGTDTQLRGTFGWTNTRLNDRGHRLRFEIKASAITRRIESRYDIPIGDPALERFSIEAINRFEELSDLDTNETTLRPSVTRVFGRWQTVTSLSATYTSTDNGPNRFTNKLLVPGIVLASVPKDFLGESLFSRTFYAELLGSHTSLGSDADFLRLDVQMERNFDLSPRWHLLLRGEFGTSLTSQFSEVPGIYRFFAGGDRSVRGFAYNSLSPEEVVADGSTTVLKKTGGRHLVTGTAELARDLPWNLGVATFFDFGNAFNSFKDDLEYAAGLGFRYRLQVASIGLDVAKPLSTNGNIRIHLNIATKL
jgi:translocation and assembly module TamA